MKWCLHTSRSRPNLLFMGGGGGVQKVSLPFLKCSFASSSFHSCRRPLFVHRFLSQLLCFLWSQFPFHFYRSPNFYPGFPSVSVPSSLPLIRRLSFAPPCERRALVRGTRKGRPLGCPPFVNGLTSKCTSLPLLALPLIYTVGHCHFKDPTSNLAALFPAQARPSVSPSDSFRCPDPVCRFVRLLRRK